MKNLYSGTPPPGLSRDISFSYRISLAAPGMVWNVYEVSVQFTPFAERAANIRAGINTDWVSRPLEDISKLVSHVETLPYLDPDKAIFAAASYGAYLLSWAYGDDSFMSKVRRFSLAIRLNMLMTFSFVALCGMRAFTVYRHLFYNVTCHLTTSPSISKLTLGSTLRDSADATRLVRSASVTGTKPRRLF